MSETESKRVPHGKNNFTSEMCFGEEADLIVWGHEHDCIEKAAPVPVTGKRYYITQPGSSIATSLAKGESTPKYVRPSPLFLAWATLIVNPDMFRSLRSREGSSSR